MDANKLATAIAKLLVAETSQPTSPATVTRKKKNRKSRKARRGGGTAQIRFARTELVQAVVLSSKKASGKLLINPSTPPILKKLGAAFERCRWERVQFYWKPCVGAMYSGAITMGIDWDGATPATTKAAISAYAPSQVTPLREDGETRPLRVDSSKLTARNWYLPNDDQFGIANPGQLVWLAEGESDVAVGEIYMTYTVVLDGPHA